MNRMWLLALAVLVAGCAAVGSKADIESAGKRDPIPLEIVPGPQASAVSLAALGLASSHKATGDLGLFDDTPEATVEGRRYPLRVDSSQRLILGTSTATIGSVTLAAGGAAIGAVDTELAAAAALADNAANPTTAMAGANLLAWDGATWDRVTNGAGAEATALRVTLANDSTGLVSVDDNAGSLTIDNAQLSVVGAGGEATAMRVTIANDSTGVVSVDDNAGALTVDWAGVAPPIGAGLEATALRVTVATDSTGVVSVDDNAASLTVDAPVGTPVFTRLSDGAAAQGTSANPLFARVSDGTDSNLVTAAGELNVIASAQPGVDVGDVTVNNAAGAAAVNVQDGGNVLSVDWNGTAPPIGAGAEAAALRVAVATDSTIALEAGTATIGTVGAIVNALPAGTNNIGDVDILTVNGQAPAFGAGAVGAAVQRVTLATDDVVSTDWNGTAPPIGAGLEATALRVTVATDSTGVLSIDDNAASLTVDNAALSVTGAGAEATALRVTLANDSTGLVSVDDNGAALTVDWAGTAPPIGAGLEATALRVTLATDSTGVVSVDDNAASLTVDSAQLPAALGGGAEAGAMLVTIANNSTGVVSVDDNGANLSVDWAGVAPPIGAGLEATALRVTIATDSTGVVSVDDNAGSLTVDNAALAVVGGGLEATALRVTLASDSTGVVSVDDNAASLTIDSTQLPAALGGGAEAGAMLVTIANNSTGLVSVDDNGGTLTTDSTAEVAPDAAFPANTMAISARASTAKPAAMSGDADAVGIWTSRTGSVRTLSGEVALVTSSTLGADLAIVAANPGNRLVLVTVRERSAATATLVIRHGTLDSDIQIVPVSLAANGVAVYQFPGGVNCDNGVFVDWLTGSVEITVGTEDHE